MIWNHFNLLLADTVTQPNPTAETVKMIGTMAVMGAALYFIMIRPQQKKAKEHQALLSSLKPGDKVVTSGGIVGVVISVKDKNVSIRSADSKFEVLKSAVTELSERGSETTESK
ncbi:MAG: preprotein translocase, YajC subunit [Verrucomicrobiales bacterium]|nr:preprotein translocase, YajC subunit [Verrucomicrobiales bacterium]